MSNISQINKPKISIQEQIARLEDKGVTFALYSKAEAEAYLEQNNYFGSR